MGDIDLLGSLQNIPAEDDEFPGLVVEAGGGMASDIENLGQHFLGYGVGLEAPNTPSGHDSFFEFH